MHLIRDSAAPVPRPPSLASTNARQARFGRLAVYASLGFLAMMIGDPARAIYYELVNNSSVVRDFVLQSDLDRVGGSRGGYRAKLTPDERWLRHTQELVNAASAETSEHQYQDAKDSYLDIIARIDALPEGRLRQEARPTLALGSTTWHGFR